jgi:hypothetical protein
MLKMDEQYWDQEVGVEEEEIMEKADTPGAFVRVNGASIPVTPGTNSLEAIKNVAKDAGLGKFRVYFNGNEIKPSQAPAEIPEGAMIELRPYDVAG